MKITFLLPILVVSLVGCSHDENASQPPNADAGLTPQQKIEKIQNDPKIPDGLKRIQTDTLRREPTLSR